MTYLIAGFVAVCVVWLLVEIWQTLEADWSVEMNEGQCAGQCRHQPCPHPWNCSKGVQS